MFGYVLPSRDRLDERERERFRAVYCGLCHTLRERYGFAASLLLNYDFTLLAILLSSGDEESCAVRRCAVHPPFVQITKPEFSPGNFQKPRKNCQAFPV